MNYAIEIGEDLDKQLFKLSKRDKATFEAIQKKVREIVQDPYHFKPLKAPLQNKRRVHISGSFVLIFSIDEERKAVYFLEFEHHDKAYK